MHDLFDRDYLTGESEFIVFDAVAVARYTVSSNNFYFVSTDQRYTLLNAYVTHGIESQVNYFSNRRIMVWGQGMDSCRPYSVVLHQ